MGAVFRVPVGHVRGCNGSQTDGSFYGIRALRVNASVGLTLRAAALLEVTQGMAASRLKELYPQLKRLDLFQNPAPVDVAGVSLFRFSMIRQWQGKLRDWPCPIGPSAAVQRHLSPHHKVDRRHRL